MSRVEDELVVECALDCKQERNRPKREVKGGERMHIQYFFHMRHGKRFGVFLFLSFAFFDFLFPLRFVSRLIKEM